MLVSPHRARRPWLGQVERLSEEQLPDYDPTCTLCPGNKRQSGAFNPAYPETFVFDNDFMAILPPESAGNSESDNCDALPKPHSAYVNDLFAAEPENGLCRVVCFSPHHNLTLPELSQAQVEAVVRTWRDQTEDLASRPFIQYVQVFENKGAAMGCSNPHPHSQIWANSRIPNEPLKELARQESYRDEHDSCLLCDYLKQEQQRGERIVCANEYFTALVPFWALWPFEVLLLSKRHVGRLSDLTAVEISALADILRKITARYDNLFETSFPYSMGFHQSPCNYHEHELEGWHLHAHFYPPLLRSATVRKFMVGYELLAMPQRDLTAETAAERLRSLSEIHYKMDKNAGGNK